MCVCVRGKKKKKPHRIHVDLIQVSLSRSLSLGVVLRA